MNVNEYRPVDRAYDPERIEEPASPGIRILAWSVALLLAGWLAGMVLLPGKVAGPAPEPGPASASVREAPSPPEPLPVRVEEVSGTLSKARTAVAPEPDKLAPDSAPPRLLGRDGLFKAALGVVRNGK